MYVCIYVRMYVCMCVRISSSALRKSTLDLMSKDRAVNGSAWLFFWTSFEVVLSCWGRAWSKGVAGYGLSPISLRPWMPRWISDMPHSAKKIPRGPCSFAVR